MRTFRAVLTLATWLFLPAALVGCGVVPPAHHDEAGAREVVSRFAETWNRHDIEAFGSLFASNADFVQFNGVRWKGREEIQKNVAYLHGTVPQGSVTVTLRSDSYGVFKASTYRFDELDVRFINNDVAVAHVLWTQLGDPRFTEPRRGTLSLVLTASEHHRWVIDAVQNTVR